MLCIVESYEYVLSIIEIVQHRYNTYRVSTDLQIASVPCAVTELHAVSPAATNTLSTIQISAELFN